MKRATKFVMLFLGGAMILAASQEQSRTYVADTFCCLCSYLFGS
jgi:hypothetical protein